MRAFWVPGKAPESRVVLDRPDATTICPASGAKLRLKDLIDVRFTPAPGAAGPHEHMDPVTQDVFTNASRLVVIKTTGARARVCVLVVSGGDAWCVTHGVLARVPTPTLPLLPPPPCSSAPLPPAGDVVLKETWDKCILPEGTFGGKAVGPEDVMELQRGGTGFAAHDKDEGQAKRAFLLGPGSGLADRRGQAGGPTSKFGLRFNN